MSQRDDRLLIENLAISFAMYCDENLVPDDECLDLADKIGIELETIADDIRVARAA